MSLGWCSEGGSGRRKPLAACLSKFAGRRSKFDKAAEARWVSEERLIWWDHMQPVDRDDETQLRRLAHELSEALTATRAYLCASRRHKGPKLREAINKATEQTDRAGEIVQRLRSILGVTAAYTVTGGETAFHVRRGGAKGHVVATFSNRQAAERFLEGQMASEDAPVAFPPRGITDAPK